MLQTLLQPGLGPQAGPHPAPPAPGCSLVGDDAPGLERGALPHSIAVQLVTAAHQGVQRERGVQLQGHVGEEGRAAKVGAVGWWSRRGVLQGAAPRLAPLPSPPACA